MGPLLAARLQTRRRCELNTEERANREALWAQEKQKLHPPLMTPYQPLWSESALCGVYQKYVVSKLASTVIEGHNDETVVSVLEENQPLSPITGSHAHARTHTKPGEAQLFRLGISV